MLNVNEFVKAMKEIEDRFSGCAEMDNSSMMFYVHLDENGNPVHSVQEEEDGFAICWDITEEADRYFAGEKWDEEEKFIREEVYPEYAKFVEENF